MRYEEKVKVVSHLMQFLRYMIVFNHGSEIKDQDIITFRIWSFPTFLENTLNLLFPFSHNVIVNTILTQANNRLPPAQDVYWLLRNYQNYVEKVVQFFQNDGDYFLESENIFQILFNYRTTIILGSLGTYFPSSSSSKVFDAPVFFLKVIFC